MVQLSGNCLKHSGAASNGVSRLLLDRKAMTPRRGERARCLRKVSSALGQSNQ